MLYTALLYRKHGWSVLPVHHIVRGYCTCGNDDCPTPGKHPAIQWTEYSKRLPTRKEIRSWFTKEFTGANIGLATGLVSNLVVVDLDGKKGEKTARRALGLPLNTLASRTGGGGLHLFYQADGQEIQTRVRAFPGIDIRGEKGFVVLPPSLHESGELYRWVNKVRPVKCDLSELNPPATQSNFGSDEGWYSEFIDGVPEGMRSNVASRLAGRYFALGMSPNEVFCMMENWNRRNIPPLQMSELQTTLRWAHRKHLENVKPKDIETFEEISDLLGEIQERR